MTADAGSVLDDAFMRTAARLSAKGLLTPGDILSQRIPERNLFVIAEMPSAKNLPPAVSWKSLDGPISGLHHRIYAARPDVGAIAAGSFRWTRALACLNISLPPVFDEQVRHLGIIAQRVPMRSTDDKPITALVNGANAFILDDTALCFGMELERLVANIEILEKCAESFVLAHCTAQRVKHIPWLVRFIANGRLKKDQKDAAARHLRGERAIMRASY